MALLLLLAMARLAALMWVPWLLTGLRLPPVAVEAAALTTGPVVGWSSPVRLVVGWPPCVVASLLLVVVCLLVRLAALGAWRPAMWFVAPLPPVAGETPALALSPVGMLLPMRLWGSSPSVASVVMMAVAPATVCWWLPRRSWGRRPVKAVIPPVLALVALTRPWLAAASVLTLTPASPPWGGAVPEIIPVTPVCWIFAPPLEAPAPCAWMAGTMTRPSVALKGVVAARLPPAASGCRWVVPPLEVRTPCASMAGTLAEATLASTLAVPLRTSSAGSRVGCLKWRATTPPKRCGTLAGLMESGSSGLTPFAGMSPPTGCDLPRCRGRGVARLGGLLTCCWRLARGDPTSSGGG